MVSKFGIFFFHFQCSSRPAVQFGVDSLQKISQLSLQKAEFWLSFLKKFGEDIGRKLDEGLPSFFPIRNLDVGLQTPRDPALRAFHTNHGIQMAGGWLTYILSFWLIDIYGMFWK